MKNAWIHNLYSEKAEYLISLTKVFEVGYKGVVNKAKIFKNIGNITLNRKYQIFKELFIY